MADIVVTEEQAKLIQAEVDRLWEFSEAAFREAQESVTTVSNWLFAVIAGGLGMAAPLLGERTWPIGAGLLCASGWCSWVAFTLIRANRSQAMYPPGYFVKEVSTPELLSERPEKLRWRLARGLDERIERNQKTVTLKVQSVDSAKTHFSFVPAVALGTSLLLWILSSLASWLYTLALPT